MNDINGVFVTTALENGVKVMFISDTHQLEYYVNKGENSQWKIYKVGEESKDIDESQIKEELGE